MATMKVTEKYAIDKAHECMHGLQDHRHRSTRASRWSWTRAKYNLAGPVKVLSERHLQGGIRRAVHDARPKPAPIFEKMGWTKVAAFQTRNPMHRSHEYLAKIAIETMDGVLIHSLLGALKPGDIPAEVRSEAIAVLVDNYFAPNTVIQAGYPLDMRYAGPREALLHALFRQNYGCSHLIVGRDHAGVGDYYGPFDAQKIFDEIPKDALETKNMNIDWTFWCNKCGGMASQRTCPHTKDDRILLSGTKVRAMLSEGQDLPVEFSRPEVAEVLQKYYAGLSAEQNVKVELKGHSAQVSILAVAWTATVRAIALGSSGVRVSRTNAVCS
ncbi:MAG: sulfate adenylyltransferase [Chromatiales bacterium]|nr:sulfate adenylyltransferase [Chromatiales bacterium]